MAAGILKIYQRQFESVGIPHITTRCATHRQTRQVWPSNNALCGGVHGSGLNYQQAIRKRTSNMFKRTALVALPAIALLMGGCANTAQLKQDIGKAQQTADGAQKSADEAKRMAQDAKSTADRANDAAMKAQADADAAKRMAGQAQQDAAAAKSAADAANEKADRMFKKAMSKYGSADLICEPLCDKQVVMTGRGDANPSGLLF